MEFNFMEDDQYQTIGLPNLLSSRTPPDVYFEWVGNRLETRKQDGFTADLNDAVANGPLAGIFDEDAFASATIDGQISLVPHIADVTNVLWYNTEILAENNVSPPQTWDELLAACEVLDAAGVTPIASGNKDLWAAGNWLAHVTSRVVGEEAYDAALTGTASFDDPKWVEAFGYVQQLADRKCINESINAIDDNEGAQLFFQGKAAMHPIGSWLVSWAIDEAPDLDFDFVNLPEMPGAGDQSSAIGVVTGYAVNAKGSHVDQAVEFLALLNSPEFVEQFIAAEAVPITLSAQESTSIDARTARLMALLSEAGAVISPPDTGYDLGTADAFYRALAEVIGGQTSPEDAAAQLASSVG
ncbi:ABC transporter substrate-binding protein [Leucobacter soli]|uniref:ABC transporter substrate-binding protein n=1 Tax=Leucobacter soli TaxID=2812850 RepID=UPI0036161C10